MGMPAKAQIELRDFVGLITATSPLDLPPGAAQVQTNVCSITGGEIQVRLGMREVAFDNEG